MNSISEDEPVDTATASRTTRALVLGGGGPVGRAWQSGLAVGLLTRGVDLGEADLIVGTSAGAIVGAELALGLNLEPLGPLLDAARAGAQSPEAWQGILAAQVRAGSSAKPETERLKVGRLALSASTISESDSLARVTFAPLIDHPWPRNLWVTAVSSSTGLLQIWHAASRAPLVRAAASSSAWPGVWPAITIGADRYIDGGVRSALNADLASGYGRVIVVSTTPLTASPEAIGPATETRRALREEIELLRAGGSAVELISPDDAFLTLTEGGRRMLDGSLVPRAYAAGLERAVEASDRIRRHWTSTAA